MVFVIAYLIFMSLSHNRWDMYYKVHGICYSFVYLIIMLQCIKPKQMGHVLKSTFFIIIAYLIIILLSRNRWDMYYKVHGFCYSIFNYYILKP